MNETIGRDYRQREGSKSSTHYLRIKTYSTFRAKALLRELVRNLGITGICQLFHRRFNRLKPSHYLQTLLRCYVLIFRHQFFLTIPVRTAVDEPVHYKKARIFWNSACLWRSIIRKSMSLYFHPDFRAHCKILPFVP